MHERENYNYPEHYFTKLTKNIKNLWILIKFYMSCVIYNLGFAIISYI